MSPSHTPVTRQGCPGRCHWARFHQKPVCCSLVLLQFDAGALPCASPSSVCAGIAPKEDNETCSFCLSSTPEEFPRRANPGNSSDEAPGDAPWCGRSPDSTSAQAGTRGPDKASAALSCSVLPAAPQPSTDHPSLSKESPCPPSPSLPRWFTLHRALRKKAFFSPFCLVRRQAVPQEQSPGCLSRSGIWSCHK